MAKKTLLMAAAALTMLVCGLARVRAQMMPNPYGASVTLENAKKVAAPAVAEAEKNHWNVAVAVVDTRQSRLLRKDG